MTSSSRRSLFFAILGNAVVPLAAFASAPLLARGLGVDGRGEVAAGTAPLMLAASAITLGLPEAVTYYAARHDASSQRKNVMLASGVLAVAGLMASLAFFSVAPLLSGGDAEITGLVRMSITMLVPSLLLLVLRGLAAGRAQWGLISLERATGAFFRLAAVLILISNHRLDAVTATIAVSLSMWVGAFVYVLLFFKKAPLLPAANGSSELLSYGWRIWLGSLAGILLARLDQLLITPLASAFELGLYAVAVSIAELILVFNNAVRDVYFTEESRSPNTARLTSAARVSTLVTLLAAAVLAVTSYWMLPLIFGADFAAAYLPLIVLLFGIVLGNPGSIAGAALSGRGHPGLRSWSLVIAVVANVVAVVCLTPALGAVGAALATCLGNVIACGFNLLWLRRRFGISPSQFIFVRRADFAGLWSVSRSVLRRGKET